MKVTYHNRKYRCCVIIEKYNPFGALFFFLLTISEIILFLVNFDYFMGKVDFEKKIFQSHIWDRGPEWVGVFLNIHNNHDPDYSEKEQFYLKTQTL